MTPAELHDVASSSYYALHIANKNIILTIVEMGYEKINLGGLPALLTDGVRWYAAELIEQPGEAVYVAAAVDMFDEKSTARMSLMKRIEREPRNG
jgi:hypothetical protein